MADPAPVLTLLVQKGPCKGESLRGRAGGAALRVGRVAKGNDLALRDAGASQNHLSVQFLPPPAARWAVTDLGSSNGTVLNGAPLVPTVPAPLSHGDLIKIGESTVLAVSIATDAGPGPGPAAARRSARNAAAVPAAAAAQEEEQGPAVTRRAGRKKAAAVEAPEAGKEVMEEPAVVTRRGGRKKAAEPPEEEKEAKEEPAVVTCRGGRKKAAEPPDAEKEAKEEAAVPSRRGGRKKATEPPEEEKEAKEEPAVVTRRGGRKKAAEPPGAEKEEEEAAAPTRRGGRKKAPEPPGVVEIEDEDEEEEAAVPRRGGSRKAAVTAALPPQPQSTRSTRAAARRGEAAGIGNGRGHVTRANARKGTDAAVQEEEEEGAVAEAEDLEGNPHVTAAKGSGEEDMVEAGAGTSNASDVPAAVRGRTTRRRGGRGRATRASARKAQDAVVEKDEKEQEEKDMADDRESGTPLRAMAVNDGGEEKVATEDGKLDGTSEAYMEDDRMVAVEKEDVSLAPEGQIGRATEGRVSAHHVPAGNGGMEEEDGNDSNSIRGEENEDDQELRETIVSESKLDGDGEEDENDKMEAISGNGEEGCVKESTAKRSLKDMTLGEWFVQVEKYLLAKNEEAAEKAIADVEEKHRRFCEHLKTLK
ncbi:hypothetical protein U9M48_033844 [Paspalum notatum var. saurae]|uniref:FHA domain-containing protein n=1 Tax=Paspalum notatum var. saurae TaxID=547442 RepID=A0AAQ3U9D1_PASNO